MFAPIWALFGTLVRDALFVCMYVHGVMRLNGWLMSKTSTEIPAPAVSSLLLESNVSESLIQAIAISRGVWSYSFMH